MFSRNPKVEEAPLQGELMLFNPDSSQFFILNATMAFIWRRCDNLRTLDTLVEALTEEFDGVDPIVAAADIRDACDELMSHGLVIDSGSAIA